MRFNGTENVFRPKTRLNNQSRKLCANNQKVNFENFPKTFLLWEKFFACLLLPFEFDCRKTSPLSEICSICSSIAQDIFGFLQKKLQGQRK